MSKKYFLYTKLYLIGQMLELFGFSLKENRIGFCSIRVLPKRNRIHRVNIPYEPNKNLIFKIVKTIINNGQIEAFKFIITRPDPEQGS